MFGSITARFPFLGQFLRFALIGVLNTGVDLGILNVLMVATGYKTGIHYTVFKTVSFMFAVTASYFLNKHWAFKDSSGEDQAKKFSQFLAVSLVGAIINVGTASLVVNFIRPIVEISFLTDQLWGNIGALCGTAIGLIWNFAGYKFLVFKK